MAALKVFVSGHQGYIGAHLVELLKADGHFVTGCDLSLFAGCDWQPLTKPDAELIQDIRTVSVADIAGHDCVMHLAALSNDAMGELDSSLTHSVNCEASVRLAKLCKQAGVPRFIYSSSCAIYGKGENDEVLDESAPLNPLTAYAQSKIDAERLVGELADDDFSPAFLRNATAHGFSPMQRLDLVANNLLASAVAHGEIRIKSDGEPWRPLLHCRDIARAMIAFMNAPRATIHNQAVNIGTKHEVFQVKDVAACVHELLPNTKIVFTGEIGADPRDYRVKFDLFEKLIPDFKPVHTLKTGLEQLHEKMIAHKFSAEHFTNATYSRLPILKQRIDKLKLENDGK